MNCNQLKLIFELLCKQICIVNHTKSDIFAQIEKIQEINQQDSVEMLHLGTKIQ